MAAACALQQCFDQQYIKLIHPICTFGFFDVITGFHGISFTKKPPLYFPFRPHHIDIHTLTGELHENNEGVPRPTSGIAGTDPQGLFGAAQASQTAVRIKAFAPRLQKYHSEYRGDT
jgi:hypothetical protein